MIIGVIGLGNIAEKAYLPTYGKLRQNHTFLFATRNPETRSRIGEMYGFTEMYETLDELIAAGIEVCFIHSATSSHYQLVKQCLLAQIHVYVDKPLSESYQEVVELKELAQKEKCHLMIGFNRRFAPMVDRLKDVPEKRLLHIQKNRISCDKDTEFMIYDLFLHVIDTAVYLLDEPVIKMTSKINETLGKFETAILQLETEHATAIVTMDVNSGGNTEIYQVTSPMGTYTLQDLTNLSIIKGRQQVQPTFNDWATTLNKRGFEQAVESFLVGVSKNDPELFRQQSVYFSHEICRDMLSQQQRDWL